MSSRGLAPTRGGSSGWSLRSRVGRSHLGEQLVSGRQQGFQRHITARRDRARARATNPARRGEHLPRQATVWVAFSAAQIARSSATTRVVVHIEGASFRPGSRTRGRSRGPPVAHLSILRAGAHFILQSTSSGTARPWVRATNEILASGARTRPPGIASSKPRSSDETSQIRARSGRPTVGMPAATSRGPLKARTFATGRWSAEFAQPLSMSAWEVIVAASTTPAALPATRGIELTRGPVDRPGSQPVPVAAEPPIRHHSQPRMPWERPLVSLFPTGDRGWKQAFQVTGHYE